MKKGTLIVGTIGGITLVLFGLFTYLMVNVNPKPLVDKTTTAAPLVQRKAMDAIRRNGSMASAVTCSRLTTPAPDKVASEQHKANARIMNEEHDTEATTRPQMRIFPNKFIFLNLTASTSILEKTSGKPGAGVTTVPPRPTVKGFKRRSLRDRKKKTTAEESLLLRIMDDKGSPRIEIKLPGNAEINKKKLRIVSRPQGGDLKIYKQQKYRVIKLMPDNTFVFEIEDVATGNKMHLNVTTPNTGALPLTLIENTMHTIIFENDSILTTNFSSEKKVENITKIGKKINKDAGINNKVDLNDTDLQPVTETTENTNNSNFVVGTSKNNFITSPNIAIFTTNFTYSPKDLKQIKRVLHVYPFKTTKSYHKVTDFNVPIVDSVFDKSRVADEVVSTIYPMTPNQIQYTAFNETMTQYPNADLHPYIPVQFFNTQTVDIRGTSEEPEEATPSLDKKVPKNQP